MSRKNLAVASIWIIAGTAMLIAGQSQSMPWDISRAAGFVAYLLLATSTALGLATSSLLFRRWLPQAEIVNLHLFTAYLSLVAIAVHVAALFFDEWLEFGASESLVPFTSPYRPLAVAMGIISAYLLSLIIASFFVKRRIGTARWRYIHYLSFPAFAMGLAHGVMAGTDSGNLFAAGAYLVSGVGIFYLTLARILVTKKEAPAAKRIARSAG